MYKHNQLYSQNRDPSKSAKNPASFNGAHQRPQPNYNYYEESNNYAKNFVNNFDQYATNDDVTEEYGESMHDQRMVRNDFKYQPRSDYNRAAAAPIRAPNNHFNPENFETNCGDDNRFRQQSNYSGYNHDQYAVRSSRSDEGSFYAHQESNNSNRSAREGRNQRHSNDLSSSSSTSLKNLTRKSTNTLNPNLAKQEQHAKYEAMVHPQLASAEADSTTRVLLVSGFEQMRFLARTLQNEKNAGGIVGILFGEVNSAVVPSSDLAGKEFTFKDMKGGVAKCVFHEIDRKWPKIGRGKRARLVVIQRKHYFQIISARLAKEDGLEIKSSFAIAKIGEKGLLKSCKNVLRNEI